MWRRWGIFVRERFEPFSHGLMIVAFYSANFFLALNLVPESSISDQAVLFSLITLSLGFFHLRLFDEWKDYQTDCMINKSRPLPRGLIPLDEYFRVTALIVASELILAFSLSWRAGVMCSFMVGYSLLMLKEFFVGPWLRKKMEVYALSHTLVAGWMGLFVFTAATNQFPSLGVLPIFLMNWMIFNVFEFARKTWAPLEEQVGVESYSQRLKPFGAAFMLSLFTGASALSLLSVARTILGWPEVFVTFVIALTGLIWSIAGFYALTKSRLSAQALRLVCTIYLILFNLAIAWMGAVESNVFSIHAKDAPVLTAADIARRADDVSRGRTATGILTISHWNDRGTKKTKQLKFYRETFGKEDKLRFDFMSPLDLTGTKFLSWSSMTSENQIWMSLPAVKAVRRLSGGKKFESFMSTEFTYEDLTRRSLHKDEFSGGEKVTCGAHSCFKITARPKDDLPYFQRVALIRADNFVPIQIEYFSNESTVLKRQENRGLEKIQGIWTVQESEMTNLTTKARSLFEFSALKYDQDLESRLFQSSALR